MIRRPPRSTLFPLHDALPIWYRFWKYDAGPTNTLVSTLTAASAAKRRPRTCAVGRPRTRAACNASKRDVSVRRRARSEEHTSELQSRQYLVCRLLLEKKHKKQ